MYFWQIERLKQKMIVCPLSERETLSYLLVYVSCTIVLEYIPHNFSNIWDSFYAIFSTLLTVLGTVYLYRQNGGANGQHFLQRYFAISWVITLRWLSIFIITTVIFFILLELAGVSSEQMTWYEFLYC